MTSCAFTRWLSLILLGGMLAVGSPSGAGDEAMMKKRRQQGILTGMPFMANIAPRTFVDDLGRKLYLARIPRRIVSLAPSVTEILFALGLSEEIVGVTPFCDYPPEAQEKPKVGYMRPNIEAIVALEPDLVIAPQSFLRTDLLAKLEQLKIPVLVLNPKSLEEILAHVRLIGRIVGRTPEAVRVTESIRQRVKALSARLEALPRPSVLYVLNTNPLITVGPGSFIHHLIELAGGTNIAAHAEAPYPRLDLEDVLSRDPEFLLFPVGRFEGIAQAEQDKWKQWRDLSAVKHGRLYQIPSDLLNRPGPRVVEGIEYLARIFHPEVVFREEATRE